MPKEQQVPPRCPVELGFPIDPDTPSAYLHLWASQGKLRRMKELLSTDSDINEQNSAGQTPLFHAALFGRLDTAEFLLQSGANPNHRCCDGSTPVHAAAFSCRASLLLKLYESGGDLRLHDSKGRSPTDWAKAAGRDRNHKVLQCMQECLSHMALHFQCSANHDLIPLCHKVRSRWSVGSLLSLSSLRVFSGSRSARSPKSPRFRMCLGHLLTCRTLFFIGHYCENSQNKELDLKPSSSLIASIPVAADIELLRAHSERDQTYENGPYSLMRNLLWRGQFVTVRELKQPLHPHCRQPHGKIDLLITEQQHCSRLHHPNLLLLMAVCSSPDLGILRLVYERVEVSSLYCLLHKKRSDFPPLTYEMIPHILLQVCEALMFLHSQGYVHRALTSHAVQMVTLQTAKLSNLEYMQPSVESSIRWNSWSHPIPPPLFNWLPPEVIRGRPSSFRSDFYSFCIIIQEVFTGTVPWNGADGLAVKKMVESGLSLAADARVPSTYFSILKTGLSPKERNRSMTLQDIRYSLRIDVKQTTKTLDPSPSQRHCQSIPPLYPDLESNRQLCAQRDTVDGKILPAAASDHSGMPCYESDADFRYHSDMEMLLGPGILLLRDQEKQPCCSRGKDCSSGHLKTTLPPNSSVSAPHLAKHKEDSASMPTVVTSRASKSPEMPSSSDSSVLLETATEHTLTDRGESLRGQNSARSSPGLHYMNMDARRPTSGEAKGSPANPTALPHEPIASSLQESSSLLEKADASLELLERHILMGIKVLEEFANHNDLRPPLESGVRVPPGGFGDGLTAVTPTSDATTLPNPDTSEWSTPCSHRQRPSVQTTMGAVPKSRVKNFRPYSSVKLTGYKTQEAAGEDMVEGAQMGRHVQDGRSDLSAPVLPLVPGISHRPPAFARLKSSFSLEVGHGVNTPNDIVQSQNEGVLAGQSDKDSTHPQLEEMHTQVAVTDDCKRLGKGS